MASIKRNIGFQTVYQILETCLPLITSPYLSRVLGASQLGVFSYTQSIVNYFTLFAMLGFSNYGTRAIAATKNVEQRSKTFWSIYLIQFATSFIALVGYSGYLLFICKENLIIGVIQTIAVLACFLNINWLYFGVEKFSISVTRNMVVRICTVILILTLVKKPEDLWIYALLMVASTFLSQVVLWFYIPRLIQRIKFTLSDVTGHIRPVLTLFVPMLAMSVYHIMDKTMLGALSSYEQSGFYYNADKVINIPAGIIGGIGTVMLPRISALLARNEPEKADSLFAKSMEGTVWAATALAFGIAAVSKEFTPLFFGRGYDPCINLIVVLSPVLIIKGFTLSIRSQYLIPHQMDKIYIYSACGGMVVNLVTNTALIPRLGAMGAVIGTLFAELAACLYQLLFIRRLIDCGRMLMHSGVFLLFGTVMFLAVRCIAGLMKAGLGELLVEISIGAVVYLALTGLYLLKSGSLDVRTLTLRVKNFSEHLMGKPR